MVEEIIKDGDTMIIRNTEMIPNILEQRYTIKEIDARILALQAEVEILKNMRKKALGLGIKEINIQ